MRSCRFLGRPATTSFSVRPISLAFLFRLALQHLQMCCVSLVGGIQQSLVKLGLATTRFVSGDQQNCLPFRIKRKSYPPDTISSIKSQLFHVGMIRALQGVHPRTSQIRPVFFQELGASQKLLLNTFRKSLELVLEKIRQSDYPCHGIASKIYS